MDPDPVTQGFEILGTPTFSELLHGFLTEYSNPAPKSGQNDTQHVMVTITVVSHLSRYTT